MSLQRPTLVLLVVGGLLLVTNPLWLFPHEGDTQYTYERSEILVENGTLTYDGKDIPKFRAENSLIRIGCQPTDDEQPRACAFDSYLVDHGPITIPTDYWGVIQPDFIQIGDGYFRRVHLSNDSADDRRVTHDVKPVTAQKTLAESAVNLSGHGNTEFDDFEVELRVAVTGETTTSFEELEESQLGRIYGLNGSYYTVVRTDQQTITHGVDILRYDVPRYLLGGAGLVLLVGAVFLRMRERD